MIRDRVDTHERPRLIELEGGRERDQGPYMLGLVLIVLFVSAVAFAIGFAAGYLF